MIEQIGVPQIEDGYVKIANDLVEALARFNLTGVEWRIVAAIMRKTYGFNKVHDSISYTQIAEITKIDRRNVIRSIQKLVAKNVITSVKADTSYINGYKINKYYMSWIDGIIYPHRASVKADTTLPTSVKADTTLVSALTPELVSRLTPTIDKRQLTKDNPSVSPLQKFGSLESIDETAISEISQKYRVSIDFVKDRLDDLATYCGAHGKKYKDYRLALINFVKSDARKSLSVAPNTYGKLTIIDTI